MQDDLTQSHHGASVRRALLLLLLRESGASSRSMAVRGGLKLQIFRRRAGLLEAERT
jgi:hypothetical protein